MGAGALGGVFFEYMGLCGALHRRAGCPRSQVGRYGFAATGLTLPGWALWVWATVLGLDLMGI